MKGRICDNKPVFVVQVGGICDNKPVCVVKVGGIDVNNRWDFFVPE